MFKSKPKCPYCGEILENPPKTKKKCPNCKNPVYFIVDPYTNKKYYLTENDAEKINNLKDRYRVEEKFFNQFNEYGLTENHFKQRRNKFEKKVGKNYSAFTFVRSIFNELSLALAKKGDLQDLDMMYWRMARFLFEYNQDFFSYSYESTKMRLYNYKKSDKNLGIKSKVSIVACGDSCEKCIKQDGKTFTIDEALKIMPIPVKDCGNGFCRCIYTGGIEQAQ